MVKNMSFQFAVIEDDLTSEDKARYRQTIISALVAYQRSIDLAANVTGRDSLTDECLKDYELADKLLNDVNR